MIPQSIARSSSLFLLHLLDPALRSLVLGIVAAFVLFICRAKTPSTRLAVWTGVLYAALAMPLLVLAVPSLTFPLPATVSSLFAKTPSAASAKISPLQSPIFAENDPDTTPAQSSKDRGLSFIAASRHSERRVPALSASAKIAPVRFPTRAAESNMASFGLQTSTMPSESIHPTTEPALAVTQTSARLPFPWPVIASTLFFLVAALMLARIAIGAILGHRLSRSAETIGDCDAIRMLIRQARAAGVASAPRLAESDVVSVPVALGIVRPVILLPVYWRKWDEHALAAVIAHEMSHIARRDALTQRLALAHRAIFWFSPLAWWLNRTLVDAAEEASDEAALAAGADRAFYAETLLGFFAALSENSGRVYWQGVSMAAPGQADRRVDRILSWKGAVSMRIRKSLAVGLALVGIPAVLIAAAARPSATQSDAPMVLPAPALPPAPAAAPILPEFAQVAPAAPIPPPSAAQVPGTPVAPAAPAIAPPAPPAMRVMVRPDLTIDTEQLQQELQNLNEDINRQVWNSVDAETLDNIQKQVTVTLKSLPPMSMESDQQVGEMKKALSELRAKETENRPEALKVKNEIAQLEGQIDMQVKQVMPVESFHFQMGPVNKISIGDFGDRFVIVSGDSPIIMSGNSQDVEHATSLRGKISGDFIWFQHDEKSYIIRDQNVVNQAKAFFKPEQDLGEKQQALGKQQQALGDQERALGDKMRDVHVAVPDLSADMEKLEAQMKQLSASGATQQQLGDLQRQLGELMRKMGQNQSQAGDQQRQVGEQMRGLGDQQRTLGDQERDLGHQQRDAAEQARTQMKQLLDDAVSKGTAQPE
jgi:beta-lactamase regulating signal transducer with metallopeptidase domain